MSNAKKVLITGGSGLIGSRLTELLLHKGYDVSHLGRVRRGNGPPSFVWDIDRGTMEVEAIRHVHAIIHLAGAGVNDKRWNRKTKEEILQSRIKSTRLLNQTLNQVSHEVQTLISASAIGYYGFDGGSKPFTEFDPPGNDFLARVTAAWENETGKVSNDRLRLVKIRIGIVLSNRGGALKELAGPIKLWAGAPLGSGDQYLSWIHLDDLCNIFIKALEDKSMTGVYNGVGPYAVTNKEMTKAIAKVLHKPLWLPAVPGFILKIIIGEVAELVLNGSIVSPRKIQEAGFLLKFKTLEAALEDLLG